MILSSIYDIVVYDSSTKKKKHKVAVETHARKKMDHKVYGYLVWKKMFVHFVHFLQIVFSCIMSHHQTKANKHHCFFLLEFFRFPSS